MVIRNSGFLIGKGEEGTRPLRGRVNDLRKMNWPLREQIDMTVFVTFVLGVVLTSSILSCDRSPSLLVDETPREGIHGH